jgi:hypothetical protein
MYVHAYMPIEGVGRRGSRRACQTRFAVSRLIMSEEAKSALKTPFWAGFEGDFN